MFGPFILSLGYNFNPSSGSTVVVCLCAIEKIESVGVCLLAVLAVVAEECWLREAASRSCSGLATLA